MTGKDIKWARGVLDFELKDTADTLESLRMAIGIVSDLRKSGKHYEPDIAACLDLLKGFAQAECAMTADRISEMDLNEEQ